MTFRIDPGSAEAPFAQLRGQILQQISDGVLEGRGRSGTFVRTTVTDGRAAPAAASARAAAERYAEATRALGLSPAEALAVVRRALGA